MGIGTTGAGFGRNSSQWNLAWALHAGVAYNVSKCFKVELAYRYLDLGSITDTVDCIGGCNPIPTNSAICIRMTSCSASVGSVATLRRRRSTRRRRCAAGARRGELKESLYPIELHWQRPVVISCLKPIERASAMQNRTVMSAYAIFSAREHEVRDLLLGECIRREHVNCVSMWADTASDSMHGRQRCLFEKL